MKSLLRNTMVLSTLATVIGLVFSNPATAVPPVPVQGIAVVDGNPGEWNPVTDFFADMCRAGDPVKVVEAKLYLRYYCPTMTMYALVLTEPGIPALMTANEAWFAIDDNNNKVVTDASGDDGIPPDFAWVGAGYDGDATHALGYEMSFLLGLGSYLIISHSRVFDGGVEQTAATTGFPTGGPDLAIDCQVPVESATWSQVKALYR